VHGRNQIGKAITVYCPQPDEACLLAERLHRLSEGIAFANALPQTPAPRPSLSMSPMAVLLSS
jgi:hypothetical protein